jgi:hypothetical protein
MMEQYAVEWTEWLVHKVLFWETDNVKKGRILRLMHHIASYGLVTMIFVSHTIYPAFWLQTYVLWLCFLAWAQHVLTNGCVISKVEQKLIGDEDSLIDDVLTLYNIEATEQSKRGILTLASTTVLLVLSLEWIARIFHKVMPFVTEQALVYLQARRIPQMLSPPLE